MNLRAKIIRKSPFGPVALVWDIHQERPVIVRVLLSTPARSAEQDLHQAYPAAPVASCPELNAVAESIRAFLAGVDLCFPLDLIALDECPPFQQAVLRAEHGIPRGCVSTYGRIAAHLERPGSARAVGNALATNPFPILIPCHRAIRSDGRLGGFQGGVFKNRALLALEGVETDPSGQVRAPRFHYRS